MTMLAACFDASGKEHGEVSLVVAGFISSTTDWDAFGLVWRKRLSADRIDYFHMIEFAQSRGEFEGWKEQETRRRNILSDLIEIIRSHTYRKFGCAIINQSMTSRIPEAVCEKFYLNAYVLAGRTCAARVREWAESERISIPIEYVFEDGDLGKGKLMEHMREDAFHVPTFKQKKDTIGHNGSMVSGFTPLQAADCLAYETFLAVKRTETAGRQDPEGRWAFKEFLKMPGSIGIYEPADLDELKHMLQLSEKIREWEGKL